MNRAKFTFMTVLTFVILVVAPLAAEAPRNRGPRWGPTSFPSVVPRNDLKAFVKTTLNVDQMCLVTGGLEKWKNDRL